METTSAEFSDQRHRVWRLELNYSLAKRLRDVTGLDFVNCHDGKALLAIHDNDEKLVQVLWLLCETQATESQISEEDFGSGLGGDALENAITALEQAILNFSRPAKRQALAAIRDKTHEVLIARMELTVIKLNSPKAKQAIQAKLAEASAEIDRQFERQMKKSLTSGNSATNEPASSVSTQDRTRSDN